MDRELSDELTGLMPIVPHETTGVECSGCVIAAVEGRNVELRCNECGAVVGVIQIGILQGLLGLACATATCPHCCKVNKCTGFDAVVIYTCQHCGKAAGAPVPESEEANLEWVDIHDDTCTWCEFNGGREPIPVMRCNRCGSHPNVDQDGVVCPLCANRSPLRSADLEKVIEA